MIVTKTFFLIVFTLVILTTTGLAFPSLTLDTFAVPGGGTLFGIDAFNGNLITINPSTGVPSIVGVSLGGPSLVIDPNTGNMYASSISNVGLFYSINPSTGATTAVGALVNAFNAPGLDFRSDGTLFATANTLGMGNGGTSLATINTNTGLLTIIGPLGVSGMGALAFAPDGTLYGATENKGTSPFGALYTINTTTGTATLVTVIRDSFSSPHPGGFSSIQFACDGTLYYGGGFFTGDFGTVNINTGVYTQINPSTTTGSLGGLAFQLGCAPPPPQPCSPPVSDDWTVSSTCTMTGDATADGNVIVPNGVVLTIPNGVTLTVPSGSNITILSGGGILIEFGGILIVIL